MLRDLLPRRRKAEKPDSPLLAMDLAALGFSLLAQSKWPEAEPVLRECLAIREKAQPSSWRTFDARSMLGGSLLGQGEYAEAEPLVVSGYEGMEAREGEIPAYAESRLAEAGIRIVRLYAAWGQPAKAAEWRRKLRLPDQPGVVFGKP